jgi:ligand-binding sensor domain-containing protein
MIQRLLLTGFLFLAKSRASFAQEYSYTHYDITDGLAGSVVYCITQDADGFIWMGTETGVSRFDGTHFRNFSGSDGLPDIEVLNMFGDSKGRVWMAPFRKSVCYFYKDSIHNQDNDLRLRGIRLKGNVENFAENTAGDILIQERTALHLLKADGTIVEYDSIGDLPIHACADICRSASGNFLVQEGKKVFTLGPKGFHLFCELQLEDALPSFIALNASAVTVRADPYRTFIQSFRTGKTQYLPFEQAHYRHLSFSLTGDSLIYINEITGATEYHLYTGEQKRFLPGKAVSRTFRDTAGNIWFTTLGQGIYRLNSDEFKTIRLNAPGVEESSIQAITKIGDDLLVGDDHNFIFRFRQRDMALRQMATLSGSSKNRIVDLGMMPNHKSWWVASDHGIEECTPDLVRRDTNVFVLKGVVHKDSNQLFVCTNWGMGIFDLRRFRMIDTLWRERTTCSFYARDTLYIGTLNGLYSVAPDRSTLFRGSTVPFLKKRISAIVQSTDTTLWISSYDAGVIGYRDGQQYLPEPTGPGQQSVGRHGQGLEQDQTGPTRLPDHPI